MSRLYKSFSGLFKKKSPNNQSENSSENGLSIASNEASATGPSEVIEPRGGEAPHPSASSASTWHEIPVTKERRNSNASSASIPPQSYLEEVGFTHDTYYKMTIEDKRDAIEEAKKIKNVISNEGQDLILNAEQREYFNNAYNNIPQDNNADYNNNKHFINLLHVNKKFQEEAIFVTDVPEPKEEIFVTEVPESPVIQKVAGQIAGAAAGQGNNSTRSSNPTVSESSPASNRSSNNSDDRLSAASTPPMLLLQSQEFW